MADVVLPQLGETVTEGTITQWFKNVGDTVAADEPLFEVSTDKVDTEVPSPVAGVLVEIRVAEGDTVDVGTVIAIVGDEASGAPPADSGPAAAEQAAPSPEPAAQPDAAPPAPTPAPPPAPPAPEPSAMPSPAPAPAAPSSPTAQPAEAGETGDAGDSAKLLSPIVRRLIAEHGLDAVQIPGSGAGGRITRDDVLNFIDQRSVGQAPTSAPAPSSPSVTTSASPEAPATPSPSPAPPAVAAASATDRDRVVPLSKIRRLTAQHMVASKATSAHALSMVEVDYANVDRARLTVRQQWRETEGFSLTYLPFICRAIIDALGQFPHLNASLTETDLIIHGYIDLGIAVDLDYEGLLAPVIRSAEDKRLGAVAREISDLADRARSRKLSPDEIQGGTFTVTNNGSAGSVLTMPIINQPQVAIVSTDAIVRRPVVVADADGEAIAIHPVGNLAMAWDHRAFDGAYAAGFLKLVKEILETRDWSSEL